MEKKTYARKWGAQAGERDSWGRFMPNGPPPGKRNGDWHRIEGQYGTHWVWIPHIKGSGFYLASIESEA